MLLIIYTIMVCSFPIVLYKSSSVQYHSLLVPLIQPGKVKVLLWDCMYQK